MNAASLTTQQIWLARSQSISMQNLHLQCKISACKASDCKCARDATIKSSTEKWLHVFTAFLRQHDIKHPKAFHCKVAETLLHIFIPTFKHSSVKYLQKSCKIFPQTAVAPCLCCLMHRNQWRHSLCEEFLTSEWRAATSSRVGEGLSLFSLDYYFYFFFPWFASGAVSIRLHYCGRRDARMTRKSDSNLRKTCEMITWIRGWSHPPARNSRSTSLKSHMPPPLMWSPCYWHNLTLQKTWKSF